MLFVLSKLFWWLAAPLNALILLTVLGAFLLVTRWRRAGRRLVAIAAVLLVVLGFTRAADLPLIWLEERYQEPVLTEPPHGIIVLGGGVAAGGYNHEAPYLLNGWIDRLTTALTLKRLHPQARLIYSGGSASLLSGQKSEADAVAALLTDLYGSDLGMEREDRSRNTFENARFTLEMIAPEERGKTWVLVTSAWHMERAMGIYRKLGWTPVAYPTDYKAAKIEPPYLGNLASDQFDKFGVAIKEFIGIAAYWMAGRWAPRDAAPTE
jgi:uncharacterized SAM-binding protein YcdF (DUF218 family)